MLFLASVLLIILNVQSKKRIKCVSLSGNNKLNELLDKFSTSMDKLQKPFPYKSEFGTSIYVKPGSRQQDLKVIVYDLQDSVTKEQFEWKRRFFHQLKEKKDQSYKFRCFKNAKVGYFVLLRRKNFTLFHDAMRNLSIQQLREYFSNLIKVFREYESMGAVFTKEVVLTFGVEKENPVLPLISNFDDLQPLGKYFYVGKRDRNFANDYGVELNNEPVLRDSLEYFLVKPTENWNFYTLITVISAQTDIFFFFHTDKKSSLENFILFKNFRCKLIDYDSKLLNSKFRKIDFDEIEEIVNEMMPKTLKKI